MELQACTARYSISPSRPWLQIYSQIIRIWTIAVKVFWLAEARTIAIMILGICNWIMAIISEAACSIKGFILHLLIWAWSAQLHFLYWSCEALVSSCIFGFSFHAPGWVEYNCRSPLTELTHLHWNCMAPIFNQQDTDARSLHYNACPIAEFPHLMKPFSKHAGRPSIAASSAHIAAVTWLQLGSWSALAWGMLCF